jgi:hypothetical protein
VALDAAARDRLTAITSTRPGPFAEASASASTSSKPGTGASSSGPLPRAAPPSAKRTPMTWCGSGVLRIAAEQIGHHAPDPHAVVEPASG